MRPDSTFYDDTRSGKGVYSIRNPTIISKEHESGTCIGLLESLGWPTTVTFLTAPSAQMMQGEQPDDDEKEDTPRARSKREEEIRCRLKQAFPRISYHLISLYVRLLNNVSRQFAHEQRAMSSTILSEQTHISEDFTVLYLALRAELYQV